MHKYAPEKRASDWKRASYKTLTVFERFSSKQDTTTELNTISQNSTAFPKIQADPPTSYMPLQFLQLFTFILAAGH